MKTPEQPRVKPLRGSLHATVDAILFPIRALFVPEENTLGLTSLGEERFELVARFSKGKVLDLGCGRGNLFLRHWITNLESVGVDVFDYEGVERVHKDITSLPFPDMWQRRTEGLRCSISQRRHRRTGSLMSNLRWRLQ